MAAMDYFKKKFPTDLDYHPDFTLLLAVSLPMLLMQVICFFVLESISLSKRMTATFVLNGFCTILLVLIPSTIKDVQLAYVLLLLVAGLYGCSVALLQVTCYSVAGPYPQFTTAFMIGIGISSFAVNCLRIFLMLVMGTDDTRAEEQAWVFFVISTLFLILCAYVSQIFIRSKTLHDENEKNRSSSIPKN